MPFVNIFDIGHFFMSRIWSFGNNQAFCDNLRFVDTQMPVLLSYLLPWIDAHHGATFEEAAQYLVQTNPYHLPEDIAHRLYPSI